MSYAAVAAHNAPPPSQQPHADPALLNTEEPHAPSVLDASSDSKITVVDPSFKDHPATTAKPNAAMNKEALNDPSVFPSDNQKRHAKKKVSEVEAEGVYLLNAARNWLLRPGVAGGLLGVVNVGLAAGVARAFYTQSHLRRDTRFISSTVAATVAILGLEGFAGEKYRQTPAGQEEERRAKKEGALIYKHVHEAVLRPGVMGGIVGLFNAAILGTVGYFSYIHWDRPTWDRRTVSAVSVGLLTLWGAEGLLAERVRKELH